MFQLMVITTRIFTHLIKCIHTTIDYLDFEKLKQKVRDKYKELKSNPPLKDWTVEEHKVLKKAYNDKYGEKQKLSKTEEEKVEN